MSQGILKIASPVTMLQRLMDIAVVRPLGKRSLLQKLVEVDLGEKERKWIAQTRERLKNDKMCDVIRAYTDPLGMRRCFHVYSNFSLSLYIYIYIDGWID